MSSKTIQERIESHIISKDGCWTTNLSGVRNYPQIRFNGKKTLLSRLMYKLHYGEIPNEFYVCHKCDNPSCVNPEHLFLGTQKDNMVDMKKKDRSGVKHLTKLNAEKVREIRGLLAETNLNQKQIAEMFGIDQSIISRIKSDKRWSHVQ
jgi:hypothetical protein